MWNLERAGSTLSSDPCAKPAILADCFATNPSSAVAGRAGRSERLPPTAERRHARGAFVPGQEHGRRLRAPAAGRDVPRPRRWRSRKASSLAQVRLVDPAGRSARRSGRRPIARARTNLRRARSSGRRPTAVVVVASAHGRQQADASRPRRTKSPARTAWPQTASRPRRAASSGEAAAARLPFRQHVEQPGSAGLA